MGKHTIDEVRTLLKSKFLVQDSNITYAFTDKNIILYGGPLANYEVMQDGNDMILKTSPKLKDEDFLISVQSENPLIFALSERYSKKHFITLQEIPYGG